MRDTTVLLIEKFLVALDQSHDAGPVAVISRKGCPNIEATGKLRYVVEQTFALLRHFKRLATRRERRTELHDAFISLACSLVCCRNLKKTRT
ncbi:hypothetical protein QNO07_01735 [Streptomyces sp. 549]|uniref:hypothetical protein n=1 Tax=Streptomyces sp. 549 TaxID=3049076 RepID=UPI0024C231E5|nr:hypothetical protein [Streptomyces sp. 549]MDK1472158.1 hypothetical protein [Streptomyces sp. 549]